MDLLEPLDVAMMAAELLSDPLHVAALLILSPPADAGPGYVDELYRDALTSTAELDPRFRRHPHVGVDTAGIWVWRSDDNIDMHDHIQRRTLPAGADREALSKLISELHSERLDRSRPMWIAYLIDGLEDGRFALYLKVHHTVVDGVAGLKMIADAMTTDPDRRSMPPLYTIAPGQPAERAAASRGLIPNPFSLVRSAVNATTSGLGFVRQLALGEISTVVASLAARNTVLPFGAPYTRFNGRLGREHAFAGASWPKSRIRAVQNAAGVSGNDVVTAVVAGVLREWLTAHDELPHKSLVAICPVTVRSREHAERRGPARELVRSGVVPVGHRLGRPSRATGPHPPGDDVGEAPGGQPRFERDHAVARAEYRVHGPVADGAVRAAAAPRLQPVDLQRSRAAGRLVLERRTSGGDLSGVDGHRRAGAECDDVLLCRPGDVRLCLRPQRDAGHRVAHTADRARTGRSGDRGRSGGVKPLSR